MPFVDRVQQWALEKPDQAAVICGKNWVSWAELATNATRYLQEPSIPTILFGQNSLDFITRFVAAVSGEGLCAVIDPSWTEDRAEAVVERVNNLYRARASMGTASRRPHDTRRVAGYAPPQTVLTDGPPGSDFLIGLTAGITSDPKAFVRTRRSWQASIEASVAFFELKPEDVTLVTGPLAASLNLFALAESLHTGSVLNILPDSHFGDAHEAIVHDGITRMVVDPHKLRVLSETGLAGGVDASGLTSIICAGSKLDARTLDAARRWAPGAAVHEYYGSSELSFVAGLRVLPGEPFPTNSTHVGYPMPGVEIRIVDARGGILADEAIGEIHVHSELTGRKYLWGGTDDVPSADGWWTAGDYGFLRNGALNILGRGADRITSAGQDVFPHEIELALASIPGISSAVVAGCSGDFRGHRIVAGIMPACGPVSAMQVRLGMDGLLAATLAPIEYFELVEPPVTERGKTSRRTLLQWVHDRDPRARRLA